MIGGAKPPLEERFEQSAAQHNFASVYIFRWSSTRHFDVRAQEESKIEYHKTFAVAQTRCGGTVYSAL
jgi:hypothetical protein